MTTTEDTTTATEVKPQHSETTWRHMLSRYPDAMAAWLLGVTREEVSEWRAALSEPGPGLGWADALGDATLVRGQLDAWAWDMVDSGRALYDAGNALVVTAGVGGSPAGASNHAKRHRLRWPGLDADPDDIACYDDVPASVGAGMLPAGLPEEV